MYLGYVFICAILYAILTREISQVKFKMLYFTNIFHMKICEL